MKKDKSLLLISAEDCKAYPGLKIPAKENEKFDTYLFLPEREDRKGEGGLRKKGYFKYSYESINGNWYILDLDSKPVKEISFTGDLKKEYKELPLITVVTVSYNEEKNIEETIKSVINQTYPNIEYIIVDGGSTDKTVEIIKKYEDQIDYWVSERDKGIYDAMNKGIMLSTGKYVLMLNAGDYFLNEKIVENVVKKHINTEKGYDIYSFQARTDTDNVFPNINVKNNPENIDEIIERALLAHQATFVSLKAYKKAGLYRNFRIRMDFDMFLRLGKFSKISFHKIPIVLYRTDGISSKLSMRFHFKMEELKILKEHLDLPFSFYIKFFSNLPVYMIKKSLSYLYYEFFYKKVKR